MNIKINAADVPVAIPPGETVLAELESRQQTVGDLSSGTGLRTEQIDLLILGQAELTKNIADKLAQFFGTSAAVWLNLEDQFRKALAEAKPGSPNGKIALRLPKSLHERVIQLAESEGVSMNHCLLSIVAEGVTRHELRRSG